MNRHRRVVAGRSFFIETLERRAMLAGDAAECIIDAECLGHVGEEEQEVSVAACWLQPLFCVDSPLAVEYFPTNDVVTDGITADAEQSVTDSTDGEPLTEGSDGQGLDEGTSVLICQAVFNGPLPVLLAVDPTIVVDPVFEADLTAGETLLPIEQFWIVDNSTWFEMGSEFTDWGSDPSTMLSDERAVGGDGTPSSEDIVIQPWFRSFTDFDNMFVCSFGEPVVLWAETAPAQLEQPENAVEQTEDGETFDAALAMASTPGSQTAADAPSRVGASASTKASAFTAQAFAAFVASFSQGASDGQSGSPTVGGRRSLRR